MPFVSTSFTLLIGQTTPSPVPGKLTEALESLEITHQVQGRSGFQLVFQTGRSDTTGLVDDFLIENPLLRPFNRVIVTLIINKIPRVLLDGMITRQEFSPGRGEGDGRITITGEDVSVMMDLEEKVVEHPVLDDSMIVNKLLLSYAKYGLIPKVTTPRVVDRPQPTERTPVQLGTDLEYIQELADRNGFLFYITPGPVVGSNTAYWGPPDAKGLPLKALLVNMGSGTNVESITAQYDALAPTIIKGSVQDRKTNQVQPISNESSTRSPLSAKPALKTQFYLKTKQFRETGRLKTIADARAQAMLDRSTDSVVTVTGELDALVYGDVLQAGRTVEVKGLGQTYDGKFYVSQVTHRIQLGAEADYRQNFTLIREGLNA